MTGSFLSGCFLSTSRAGGVVQEPAASTRSTLLPAAPVFHPGGLASGILPKSSRWLLTARTFRDEPITAAEVLPPQREAGMLSHPANRAFEPLRDPDHATSAILFLSGMALFLASSVLGMLSTPPQQPDLPAPTTNSAPVLPVLIASPCAPLSRRTPA